MYVDADRVAAERARVHERADVVVPLLNEVRDRLGEQFGTDVASVTLAAYHDAVDDVFADGDRAVNVAALVAILRNLDVAGDYPGFVVDELLGRELAATIAGEQPLRLLAESTFHYADVVTTGEPAVRRTERAGDDATSPAGDGIEGRPGDGAEGRPGDGAEGRPGDGIESRPGDGAETDPAGMDDLDAALAAGFQTCLPGWEWTETESPFAVE